MDAEGHEQRGAGHTGRVDRNEPDASTFACGLDPSSLNGASYPADAGRACGAPLTLETSASPAGLTARARPEARPETARHYRPHETIFVCPKPNT